MGIFDDLWGRVDAGLETLGNTAGQVWDAATDNLVDSIRGEQPANVTRPETIPDQNQPTTTRFDEGSAQRVAATWEQLKVPVMIAGALVVAGVIYLAVKD